MSDPNVHEPDWDHEFPDPPFRARAMRLGPHTGATEIGATLYDIDPGGSIAPYHVHHGNEELLIVLSGTPLLRTPDGARTLQAGAVVAFARGPAGAHRISNASVEPVRLLMFSTMNFPEVAEHLDTGTWLAMTDASDVRAFPSGSEVSVVESSLQAMQAATDRESAQD